MQILKRGAEAILYLEKIGEEKVLVKERIKKGYRINELDFRLRKSRTRKEVKLLNEARKIGVMTPKIFEVDEKSGKIVMEFVDGILIKEYFDFAKKEEIEKVCFEIGKAIAKLHLAGIIHGDITTSNMILKNGDIYFVDFGLGEFSNRIESKAVDLRLLREAINATHSKILEICWKNILKGYKEYKDANKVLMQLEEIRKRARYVER